MTAPGRLRIAVIHEPSEFSALGPAWNQLAAATPSRSVFLQHEWFCAALEWPFSTRQLCVWTAWEGERLVGAMPLVTSTASGIRRLGFLEVPDTQLCDLLALPGCVGDVVDAIAAELRKREQQWDELTIGKMPSDALGMTALHPALQRAGITTTLHQSDWNRFLHLKPWDEFMRSRTRSLKKAVNLAANRLDRAGCVEVEWLRPDDRDCSRRSSMMAAAVAVSERSWKQPTGFALTAPGPHAFMAALSSSAQHRGWLSLWLMRINGQPVAMECQLLYDRDVYALRSDFDATFASVSPGSNLQSYMLREMSRSGLNRYFMGVGENTYKARWCDERQPLWQLQAFSRSLRGVGMRTWRTVVKPSLRRLKASAGASKLARMSRWA